MKKSILKTKPEKIELVAIGAKVPKELANEIADFKKKLKDTIHIFDVNEIVADALTRALKLAKKELDPKPPVTKKEVDAG